MTTVVMIVIVRAAPVPVGSITAARMVPTSDTGCTTTWAAMLRMTPTSSRTPKVRQ